MISDVAYSEINYIINKMSEDLQKKIPIEFIKFIENNDKGLLHVDTDNIKDLELHEDTKRVLSVLYTDYIATEEERKIIKNKERIVELKKEEEKSKKYGTDVFQKQENNNMPMLINKKEKWYRKLFNKIKKLFKL